MVEDFIPTLSGRKLYYREPEPEQIELEDIAHGLSMHPRYGGQAERFFSVARHSILVSRELENRGYSAQIQLYGLLHDAPEAYLGDVPAPLKKGLENLRQVEEEIMKAVWMALDLEPPAEEDWRKVKEADEVLLNHEAPRLVSRDGWTDDIERSYSLSSSRKEDKKDFIDRFRALRRAKQ